MATLIFNAKIYVQRNRFEEAMLIDEGVIQALGTNDEMLEKYVDILPRLKTKDSYRAQLLLK